MKRIIEQTEDGSATLFVPELNEHYHSVKGALTESRHIFIDMGLKAASATRPHILEIGFGTGLNALLTLEAAEAERRHIYYTGIELYPLAWEEVEILRYSGNPLFKALHEAPWEEDADITPHFTLHKMQADARELKVERGELKVAMQQDSAVNFQVSTVNSQLSTLNFPPSFDVIYFDAFAPEKQPEMWDEQIFRALYASMNRNGVLTTYCAKGSVRRMLQAVGFKVERLPGPPGGKREILRASKTGS